LHLFKHAHKLIVITSYLIFVDAIKPPGCDEECGPNAKCVNGTNAVLICKCNDGYQGDGVTCKGTGISIHDLMIC